MDDTLRYDYWFEGYIIFVGPWLSFFPTWEYYKLNQEYFDKLFK